MVKKYSLKFWIIFWLISIVFLTGWFFYWQTKFQGVKKVETAVSTVLDFLPVGSEQKDEYKAILAIGEYFFQKDNAERTFLVLFQNNLEIRPGGGYIGSFGIVKIKNGKITEFQTHDLSNFDARIPDVQEPPYPMRETLHIDFWKLRDSNYSPDFEINAKKAIEFYQLGEGQEKFKGVIAITANVLNSFLKVVGPVEIEGYPGEYKEDNAILSLEYQVEKGYTEQGIEKGERKSVMNELANEIMKRVYDLSNSQKLELAKIILEDLNKKDIQLYFEDQKLQSLIKQSNWAGKVDENWDKDYLMVVDANLGAYKSDYYVKRSAEYSVDLTKEKPEAILKLTYNHTAKQKDWMTNDYTDYLRTYVPERSWLDLHPELDNPRFGNEFGKKYFGFLINVPIGSSRTFEFHYTLPEDLKNDYQLKIQKQAGLNDIPVIINIINKNGAITENEYVLNSDMVVGANPDDN